MVARVKISTGESSAEEIRQAFREELKGIMKNAALKFGCPVEQLKCRFDNLGCVEVQKMTLAEMAEKQREHERQKRAAVIRRRRA